MNFTLTDEQKLLNRRWLASSVGVKEAVACVTVYDVAIQVSYAVRCQIHICAVR